MTPASIYNFDVPANGSYRLQAVGQFFRILASLGSTTVQSEIVNLKGLLAGDGMEKTPFTWLMFTDTSGATNTMRVVVSDSAFINSPLVQTAITANKNPISASFTNTAKTITNVSAQLIAGNSARQYLMVQNRDATGVIYLNFGAGAATAANGVKIGPGGFWEWDSIIPNLAVQAIGDIASNANILVLEG